MAVTNPVTASPVRARSLEQRTAKAREKMKAAGVDVLVAWAPPNHNFQEPNCAWYFSGFRQMGQAAYVLPLDAEPVYVMTPAFDAGRAKEEVWIKDVVGTDDLWGALSEITKKRGWRGKQAATTGLRQQTVAATQGLQSLFDRPVTDGDKIFASFAYYRDEWSMENVMKATRIAEKGFDRMCELARPGMPEAQLNAEVEMYQRELGAEDCFQIMSSSQHNYSAHNPTERLLQAGDVILGEITPAVEGEFVQICRSAYLGEPPQLYLDKFALLDQGLVNGLKAAKDGAIVKDVVDAINAPLDANNYGKFARPPYMRTRGHGMSLGPMEPRELAPGMEYVLREGMVFCMHPNQYIPETGYFMCGEPVRVEKDGARLLTQKRGVLQGIPIR